MKILCFSEKTDFMQVLGKFLINEGFQFVLSSGIINMEDIAQKYIPDIIVIDSSVKATSPYSLIKSIKGNEVLTHSPIFLLIEEKELNDLEEHVEIGVDEVVLKPFDLRYLVTRIKLTYRMFMAKDNNPLTGLPGNKSIASRLQNAIINQEKEKFAILYADLDHFKPYNDIYGFSKGDEVILYTAKLLQEAIDKFGDKGNDFLGHIGGDDYIIITIPERVEPICEYIIKAFDAYAPNFYSEEDRKKGFIVAKDREGAVKQFELLSISLAAVTNLKRCFASLAEIGKVAAEVKKVAKGKSNSSWAIDKREGDREKESDFLQQNKLPDRREFSTNKEKKAVILVVDDQVNILDYIKNLLTLEGYEVETENSPEKAILKTSFKRFDLILADINMPSIDGLTMIREIKKTKYHSQVPFIIFSAYVKKEIILEAIKLGAKKVFAKPFDINDFKKTIDTVIKSSKII